MKYLILLSSMFLAVAGQLFLKKGVGISTLSFNIASIAKTLFSPLVFTGLFIYGLSSVIWLFVLQKFPLSVAYPSLAITYIIVVMASIFILREPITTGKLIGSLLIVAGVYFLNK